MEEFNQYQDIKYKSSKGIKWLGIAELFIRLFQFSATIILARLLMPQDFGVISIALIFTQLAYVLFDFGFSSALIQKKDITEKHYSTIFFVYITSAFVFTLIVFIGSPLAAAYFKQEILQGILNTLTLIFFFYALSAIPQIRLMKEMRFKHLGLSQIVSVFTYGVVTIFFAWQGAGVWSFVYGIIAEQFVLTILLYVITSWLPGLHFQWTALRDLAGFGGNVLGTRIVGYINSNSPNFIIGRVLGAVQLGFYSIAYQLIEFPVQRISKNILKVMFPAFSKLQDDPENYKALYKQTVYHLALLIFPVYAGMVLIAPQFIKLLYGEKWIAAIIPLQILTAAGIMRSLWSTTSLVFLSKGKPQVEFKINLTYCLFLIPAIYAGTYFGIVAVVTVIAVIMTLFLIIAEIKALKIIEISCREMIPVFIVPLTGVGAFVIIDIILKYFLLPNLSDIYQLILTVTVSVLIYFAVVIKFDRAIIKKLIKFIRA